MNYILTHDQREEIFAAFARLGTKRLRPIFDDMNGTIPYDELKRCLLYYMTQDEFRTEEEKTLVCLAASRKYSGFCIAGKEWRDSEIGPWLRPVSRAENGELSTKEICLDDGKPPRHLDIITIKTTGTQEHLSQRENIVISEYGLWIRQGKFPIVRLPKMVDDVADLWQNGYLSGQGLNDRIPEMSAKDVTESSLYLIRPDDFTLVVSHDLDGLKKVRARFTYYDVSYLFSVTDQEIEKTYLMRKQGEYPLDAKKLYLTISFGEPFNEYCYKLVAAVIMMKE